METYIGYIKTPQDALYVFEACRRGLLNRVQRRLSSKERMKIDSGSIFVWDEREACMRRWTDGRTWSPSRVLGSFLTYKELDTKRRPRKPLNQKQYSYKVNGLIKQSFSICTRNNQKLHLISYYKKQDLGKLKRPSEVFNYFEIPNGVYPDLQQPYIRQGSIDSSSDNSDNSSLPSLTHSPTQQQDNNHHQDLLLLPTPDSIFEPTSYSHDMLPIQDIAWEKLPSTEDIRQLNALRNQLKI